MPARSSRSSSPARGGALNDVSNRRNPRRGMSSNYKEFEENYDYDSIDDAEIDQKPTAKARGRDNKKKEDARPDDAGGARRSSRSNKFQASLKEPSGESIRDLLNIISTQPIGKRKSRSRANSMDEEKGKKQNTMHAKSPAVRHNAVRRQVKTQVPVSEDDWSDDDEDDEEEAMETDEEELKIQRIIASKSERRRDWKEICAKINTSEIESGSRWYEDASNGNKKADDDTFEERFLVKWDDLSYLHCSWETQEDLVEQLENAKNYLSTFFRKSVNGFLFSADERCDGDYFDPSYTQVERILQVELPENGTVDDNFGIIMDKSHPGYDAGTGRQFLVKWGSTPYSDCTYEFERDLIINEVEYEEHVEEFYKRSKKPSKSEVKAHLAEGEREFRKLYVVFGDGSKMEEDKLSEAVSAYQKDLADVVYPNGGQLRDYQAEGVSWMVSNYLNGRSCLLADEMGLGKTLQTCSFINILANKLNRKGPFLVVAPLSTLEHWKREFNTWTGLNTIVYHGSAKNREQTRELEFAYAEDRPPQGGVAFNSSFLKKCQMNNRSTLDKLWMVQVVVTTPEMMCTDDFVELTAVEWDAVVVDEAHRLKSHSSKLAMNLRDGRFVFHHTLLLTGTPIQNNMTELWALLNVIDPDKFGDLGAFLEIHGNIKSKEGIDELHGSIRPYILRRLKEDVEKSVPPKEETLIEVELTPVQKQYYRALYEKNVQFLHRNKKKPLDGPSLNNLAMQLRKCCNHAFLLNGVEEEIRAQEKKAGSTMSEADFLVKCSGKLVLLDKLLPRLQSNGHRVLIFSQFKIMLDIIEDFLHERKFKAERIDGSITGKKRQMAIDRFQSPATDGKEAPFIMMLSTRAGGVGINLTAADTCIIFDSDWNPQNDLQAQARCHRIGQTKSVKVYRLLTRKTYEMQMFHLSSMKMGLDQAVLHGFESGGGDGEGTLSKDEVEKLLRHGAYDIFNEERTGTGDAESNAFVEQDIDWILERRATTVVHENTGSASSAAGGTFSKASFKAHASPGASNDGSGGGPQDVDIDDPEFWTKMVGAAKVDEESFDTGKKRKRKEANYSESLLSRELDRQLQYVDSDGSESDAIRDDDFGEDDASDSSASPRKKNKREFSKWGRKNSQGWKRVDADKLVKAISTHGYGNMPWDEVRKKADLSEYDCSEIQQMSWAIMLSTLREVAEENVIASQRRAERAIQKKIDDGERRGDGNKHDESDRSGGVLAMDHGQGDNHVLDDQLESLIQGHGLCLARVFRDAKAFGSANERRPEHAVERYARFVGKGTSHGNGENALFAQNLWPQLKNRGWKVEQVDSGGEVETRYIYGGETYKSPEAAMAAASVIHPQLNSIVEEIRLALATRLKKVAEENAIQLSLLELGRVNMVSLEKFLNQFAPLQLIVDRATTRRLNLTKKLLVTCSALCNAYDIVNQAGSSISPGSIGEKISQSLNIERKIQLPHPAWTVKHDAVLIQAIAKHGWIEFDACCRAITEDQGIEWGAPFDGVGGQRTVSAEDAVHADVLSTVAERVTQFLTAERDILDALKDFREAMLVKTYGLKKISGKGESGVVVWTVDKSQIRAASTDADASDSVDLPTKKDLVKRAKMILAKRIVLSTQPVLPSRPEPTVDHDFYVLDQKDPANVFLAEIMRALIKVSFTKRRQVGRRLMNSAITEAKNRISDLELAHGKDSECVAGMARIVEHCLLANRYIQTLSLQAKNVVRAILGQSPSAPKGGLGCFPPERAAVEDLLHGAQAVPPNPKTKKLRPKKERVKGASGDIAISEAMTAVLFDDSCVQLSAPETLLLTVVCSQGLPVWTEDWRDLIDSSNLVPEKQGPGFQNAISWWGMGQVFEAAAKVWHHTALKKLESLQASFIEKYGSLSDTDTSKLEAKKKLDDLKYDEARKRMALAIAGDYKHNPEKLAKKCIMLLESLRNHMGPVETIVGKNQARIATLHKTENGLGPFVLEWLSDEIRRWAESLALVDDDGQPFSLTAADFPPSHQNCEAHHEIAAIMNPKCCRSVFSQVAQQSRVREVFLKNTVQDVKSLLETAVRDFAPAEEWEHVPDWWGKTTDTLASYSVQFDYLVLDSLLEFGYSEIEENLAAFFSKAAQHRPKDDSSEKLPSTSNIQLRANQLACALHMLDRTQCALQEVQKKVVVESADPESRIINDRFGSLNHGTSGLVDSEFPSMTAVAAKTVDLSNL